MKKSVILFSVIALLFSACEPSGEYFDGAICIENISTIDPQDGLKENQTVIIKEGKIEKITPSDEIRLADNNEIIDGTGKYLIPGLWDAHIHFAYIEELAPRMFDLFLAYGVTSVRDTGGKIDFVKHWKERALSSPTEAPRVMIAGPLLDGIPNVYDGSTPERPPLSVGLDSEKAVTEKIHELDSLGVDLLKAYEMLTPEQFTTLIQQARKTGYKVTGHVPLSMDVISASNAGLNSMEHMRNLELSVASNAPDLLEQRRELLAEGRQDPGGILRSRIHETQRETAIRNYDEEKANEVLQVLAENQTWQIPTLALNTAASEKRFTEPGWQETFKYLPDSIEQDWISRIEDIQDSEVTPFRREYSQWLIDMAGRIHRAGIDIMAGTDTPIYFLTPGYSLHQELTYLVEAGLSPLDALKTATLNPARYFNLEEELGSVKENMWADLVILDANPLENIRNTLTIHSIFKQGKYYSRDRLDQILRDLDLSNQ